MSLPILVAQDKWQDFDDAWNELMLEEKPLDDLLRALKLAGDKKRISRCLPLVRQHVEYLQGTERHGDIASLLGAALAAGGPPSELADGLLDHARKAWGEEIWWAEYTRMTGLEEGGDLRRAWRAFERLRAFVTGVFVFHAGGWGAGEIIEVKEFEKEIVVRFQNGRTDRFPMGAAIDIFEPLPGEDLRALACRDPEGTKKEIKKDPLFALRAIVQRYNGRATLVAIKNALAQVGLEGSAWSAWWRKAKKLAENSEWFRLSGSGQKTEVRLLLIAADPVEQLERQLKNLATLEDVLERSREFFAQGTSDEGAQQLAVRVVEEQAEDDSVPLGVRVAAWMFLRERRSQTPDALLSLMAAALEEAPPADDPTHLPRFWALWHELPTTRDQEAALGLIKEVFGDGWMDAVAGHLQHVAPGMVRSVVDQMMAAKRYDDLARHYRELLVRPVRSPHVLVALARLVEAGKVPGEYLPPVQRAQALLTLATHLYAERRKDAALGRLHSRLVELLAGGREPLLEKLLEGSDHATLHSVQLLIQRGVEEAIDNLVTSLVFHAGPGDGEERGSPFWEEDVIWTSRSALERFSRELRELVDVKMPENEDAIGRAAAMGDISENAEWEAAMEEKRNLSGRAAQMKDDLSKASPLEQVSLPEDTVCPGTKVRYRVAATGEEHEIVILGPWDTYRGDDVVSYRAPLAAGMLGLHAGEQRRIELPAGTLDVEVLEVEPTAVD